MNVLVLKPGVQALEYGLFESDKREAVLEGRVMDYRGLSDARAAVETVLGRLAEKELPARPDVVAIRVLFGGEHFKGPTIANDDVVRQLGKLIPNAPLHLPAAIVLIEACRRCFDVPVVLDFETAFFAELPEREYTYALDPELARASGFRRYGYHGITHRAACGSVASLAKKIGRSPRVLSVCLEPRPEIAAVIGGRPVMVTSGATPLEGLPGHTTCGELDPSIVLMLAGEGKLGPEQINRMLTQESGLMGLAGKPITFAELFESSEPELEPVRALVKYRILLACGAGIAAMGGVDAVVFSGRFAALGRALGPWLTERVRLSSTDADREVHVEIFETPHGRIMADTAAAALSAQRRKRQLKVAG